MTKKQQQILNAALELFSKEGYHATSTSKVAKKAGVSEGLIFRHFKNKEGLIDVILREGEKRIAKIILPIVVEDDPKQVIKKTIELPFNVEESEFEFWRLQFKLKWELNHDTTQKMKPLKEKLVKAFTSLRYKKPELEAELLAYNLDGISAAILKGHLKEQNIFKEFLINKYHL